MDVGEQMAAANGLSALHMTHDPDGVVDRVVLRPAPAAELERRDSHVEGSKTRHDTVARSAHLAYDRRAWQAREIGIPALRTNPPLVRV